MNKSTPRNRGKLDAPEHLLVQSLLDKYGPLTLYEVTEYSKGLYSYERLKGVWRYLKSMSVIAPTGERRKHPAMGKRTSSTKSWAVFTLKPIESLSFDESRRVGKVFIKTTDLGKYDDVFEEVDWGTIRHVYYVQGNRLGNLMGRAMKCALHPVPEDYVIDENEFNEVV